MGRLVSYFSSLDKKLGKPLIIFFLFFFFAVALAWAVATLINHDFFLIMMSYMSHAPQPHLAMYNVSLDMTINIIHGTCARETPTTTHAYSHSTCMCSSRATNMPRSGRYTTVSKFSHSPTQLTHLTPFQSQLILFACQILSSLWLVILYDIRHLVIWHL